MLGADGPGKAEATVAAVIACSLFCDEWAQASHGGELTTAVEQGLVTRDVVTDLGAVLAGDAPGRPHAGAVTLFDSTGLAIQDLAIAAAAYDAWRAGRVRGDDRRVVTTVEPVWTVVTTRGSCPARRLVIGSCTGTERRDLA